MRNSAKPAFRNKLSKFSPSIKSIKSTIHLPNKPLFIKLAKSRSGLDHQILNVYADEDQDCPLNIAEDKDSDKASCHPSSSQVDGSDDEEIEEDAAFDSSDEEQFAGYKFYGQINGRRSTNQIKRLGQSTRPPKDQENDRESGASETENSEDYVDLSEMLGTRATSTEPGPLIPDIPPKAYDPVPTPFINADEIPSSSDDDLEDDDQHDLGDQILQLLQTHDDSSAPHRKKRKVHPECIEAYEEGEYALPGRESKQLDINSLVSVLSGEKDLGKLKRQVVRLRHDNEESKIESAPMPDREKSRISRIAGFSTVSQEVDRFQPIVERNRNANNVHFDLVEERGSVSTSKLVTEFQPSTDLDHAIASVVTSSQFQEPAVSEFGLPMNPLDTEQVLKSRKEMRWMRELAFRHELKAKRHAKIKSKTYRKILKKQKNKDHEEQLQRVLESDPEAARAHLVQLEVQRVKSRLTQKSQIKSKWAQVMVKHGELAQSTVDSRNEILEKIKAAELLQDRIRGCKNDDTGSDSDGPSPDENGSDLDDDNDLEVPEKGLFAMKFMQRAAEENAQELLRKGTDDYDDLDHQDDDEAAGRRTIGTGTNPSNEANGARASQTAVTAKGAKSASNKTLAHLGKNRISSANIDFAAPASHSSKIGDSVGSNPWTSAEKNVLDRSTMKLGKLQKKQQKQLIKMDARQEAEAGKSFGDGRRKRKAPLLDMDVIHTVIDPVQYEEDADGDQAQHAPLQRDLVQQAFAGDDVVMEFEQEKRALEQKEGDQEIDETLPGWGCWGGSTIKPRTGIHVKLVKGVASTERQDRLSSHVQISEKRQKQLAAKYMAPKVPYPYESVYQYELAMRQSIGKEWVTSMSLNELTTPKVTRAEGVVIKPVKFNKAQAEAWIDQKKRARRALVDKNREARRRVKAGKAVETKKSAV